MKKTITSLLASVAAMGLAAAASSASANGLHINFAVYGFKGDPQLPNILLTSPVHANSAVVTQRLAGCEGQNSCGGMVDNAHLGDPAPNMPKRLWIQYSCNNAPLVTTATDEGQTFNISCAAATPAAPNPNANLPVMSIVGTVDVRNVAYDKAKSLITTQCAGKRDCVFTLRQADFITPPQRLDPPLMYVQWDCVAPDHSKTVHMPSALLTDGQPFHFVCQ